jgi:toxin ParE1/3/4
MGRISRRPRAEEDLLEIWSFVARDDADAADRLLDRIGHTLALIAERPHIGRERNDLGEAIRSFSSGNYVLF